MKMKKPKFREQKWTFVEQNWLIVRKLSSILLRWFSITIWGWGGGVGGIADNYFDIQSTWLYISSIIFEKYWYCVKIY